MAFYIELHKIHNDEKDFAYYVYDVFLYQPSRLETSTGKLRCTSKLVNGKIRINKITGDVDVVQLAEGDNGIYMQRAGLALIKHWEKGEFPERTCWAS